VRFGRARNANQAARQGNDSSWQIGDRGSDRSTRGEHVNKTSRVLSSVAATGAVFGASLGFAGPATAASHAKFCRSNHHGAYVCFQPYGDHLFVKDTARDGYSAAVYWKTSYGRAGVCINEHGVGTLVDCNYNMREKKKIKFWAVDINLPTNTYRYWSAERNAPT
jgi:hypothetical protein